MGIENRLTPPGCVRTATIHARKQAHLELLKYESSPGALWLTSERGAAGDGST